MALKQTGTVQKYLNDLDRLNQYTDLSDNHLINIILNGIPLRLGLAMAYYEDLRMNPAQCKQKLIEIDVAIIHLQQKDTQAKHKDKGYKRSFEDRVQLPGRDPQPPTATRTERVPDTVKEKRKSEGCCIKDGRKGYSNLNCYTGWRAKTP